MELTITVDGGEPAADVRSLQRWLSDDPDLRGLVQLVPDTPGAGEMGGIASALTVALGAGGVGVALARALSVWLRNRTADVRATVTGKRGTVTIDVRRARDPHKVLEDLERIADVQ